MSWRPSTWTLTARLTVLFLIAAAVVGASITTVSRQYLTVQDNADFVSTDVQGPGARIEGLRESTSAMGSAINSIAVSNDVADIAGYVEGSRQANQDLAALRELLAGDPEFTTALDRTQRSLDLWRSQVARPVVRAVRAGNAQKAREVAGGEANQTLFNDVRAYVDAINFGYTQRVEESFREQDALLQQFAATMILSIVMIIALIAGAFILIRRDVLTPLRNLGQQLRTVTDGDHEVPIQASGPPDITVVGQDAEYMRRKLVEEIDEARASREILANKEPLANAVRVELEAPEPPDVEGLEVYGTQIPAEGIAGDWWSSDSLPDGRISVCLTDVSGHGAVAGIDGLEVKSVVRMAMEVDADPAGALEKAAVGFRTPGRTATCAIVLLDPETGELTWASAGHPPPWLVEGDGHRELEPTGPMLSALGGQWDNHTTVLGLGEILLMWTDGLTESRDEDGSELSEEQLRDYLDLACEEETDLEGIVTRLVSEIRNRAADWNRDDVTVVAMRRNGD